MTVNTDSLHRSTGVNEALLREILTFIELHPERWDQGSWWDTGACGTTGCLAGWTVVLADPLFGPDQAWAFDPLSCDIDFRARNLLGLSEEQAHELFFFTQVYDEDGNPLRRPTFRDMCERVERVTGIRIKPPEDLGAA